VLKVMPSCQVKAKFNCWSHGGGCFVPGGESVAVETWCYCYMLTV
jgi:hypothetical protein